MVVRKFLLLSAVLDFVNACFVAAKTKIIHEAARGMTQSVLTEGKFPLPDVMANVGSAYRQPYRLSKAFHVWSLQCISTFCTVRLPFKIMLPTFFGGSLSSFLSMITKKKYSMVVPPHSSNKLASNSQNVH